MTAIERRVDGRRLAALIARSHANVTHARRLCEQARASVRPPIAGGSGAREAPPTGTSPASNGHPQAGVVEPQHGRSVLVLVQDPVARAFIVDALRGHHDAVEVPDARSVLEIVASGRRVDMVVAGCFMLGEARAPETCTALARALYDGCPWVPVVVVADTPSPTLKADLLLTGVRAFLPKDVTPGELVATVARMARRPDTGVPTTARVAVIKQTFGVLERAITDVPALAALAATAAMSRSHFSRTFHAVAGISLRDYVRDLRLKRAQELMRVSRLSLSTIATEAGFYDLPHFNKAFRHRFGMSPTQFRLASQSASSAT